MHVPRTTMEEELKGQEKELSDDITSLNKKVGFIYHLSWKLVYTFAFKSKYLEKQYNDAQSQLRDIVSFYQSSSKDELSNVWNSFTMRQSNNRARFRRSVQFMTNLYSSLYVNFQKAMA